MEDLKIAQELAEALSDIPEPFKHDAFRILLKYRLGIQALPQTTTHPTEAHAPAIATQGFPQFYRSLSPEPKMNPHRFAAVAFYYREYLKQMSVNQNDIVDTMQEAGLPPPKNFPRDIRLASDPRKRNSLLMSARDEKDGAPAWQLSKAGEDFLSAHLQS